MIVKVTSQNGIKLLTADKLCKEDITVIPDIPAPEITSEDKTVTPSEETQVIKPELADYLGTVTVEPIPEEYVKIDDDDIVTFDKNGTYDVGHKRTAVVAVSQTSGECTGDHILKVDELPDDEGASETDIYLCDGKYYKFAYVEVEGGTRGKWTEYAPDGGEELEVYDGTVVIE